MMVIIMMSQKRRFLKTKYQLPKIAFSAVRV